MPVQTKKILYRDIIVCGLIAVLTFAVTLYFGLYGCDPHHDGVMFEPAFKVAHGATLFRDTFTQYGALAVYYDALFIILFGDSMASLQIGAAFGLAACGCMLYTVSKKLTGRTMAVFAALLAVGINYIYFWHSHPWSSIPAMFFQLLACELTLQEHVDGRHWKLAAAGVCAALGAWCRLPVGLLTFLSGAVGLALTQMICRRKGRVFAGRLAIYAAGFAAAIVLLLLPMLLKGTLGAWYGMVIVGTSDFAKETNTAGASSGFIVRMGWSLVGAWIKRNPLLDWIWLALPATVCFTLLRIGWPVLCGYAKSIRNPRFPLCIRQDQLAVIVCSYACGGWAQYYPVSDYRHWYWAAVPMLPVLIYAAYCLARRYGLNGRFAILLLSVALAGNLGVRSYFALATAGAIHYEKDTNETRPGLTSFYMDENWNRNDAEVFDDIRYPYLNGLRLSSETAGFYKNLYDVISELRKKYPEKNIYNRTAEGFLGVFQTEYIPYGNAPYSEYTLIENNYIEQEKPVMITQSETDWQGYTPDYGVYAVIQGNDGRLNNSTIYIMVAE